MTTFFMILLLWISVERTLYRGGGREPMTTLFINLTHPSSMDICRERLYVEGWGEQWLPRRMFHKTMTTLFMILTHPSSMDICRKIRSSSGTGK